jgi:hypothetical protein
LFYYIRLGLFLLLKTNLLEENVVNAQFSHVTCYQISVCLLHFFLKFSRIQQRIQKSINKKTEYDNLVLEQDILSKKKWFKVQSHNISNKEIQKGNTNEINKQTNKYWNKHLKENTNNTNIYKQAKIKIKINKNKKWNSEIKNKTHPHHLHPNQTHGMQTQIRKKKNEKEDAKHSFQR